MGQWQSTVNTVDYNAKPHRRHTATMSKTIMTVEHNTGRERLIRTQLIRSST